MEVLSNNASDGINKSLELTQALAKKDLKFFLDNGDVDLIFNFPRILLLAKQGNILKEFGGKWHPVLTLGLGDSKMVLTLLEEVITLQVSFTPIYVRKLGL